MRINDYESLEWRKKKYSMARIKGRLGRAIWYKDNFPWRIARVLQRVDFYLFQCIPDKLWEFKYRNSTPEQVAD